MTSSNTHNLWMGTLAIAGAGALMSACGPQDGASTAPTAQAAPAAAPAPVVQAPVAQAPASVDTPAPAASPAPAPAAKPATVHVAKPVAVAKPAAVAKPITVTAIEPAPEVKVAAAPPSNTVGAIRQIDPITDTNATGVGAVAGGALGGVVGHQFGKGDGKKAMTVLGVIGGAVAGHQVERAATTKVIGYRVQVQLDNGETRILEAAQLDGLRVGDRVRVEQGQLRRV